MKIRQIEYFLEVEKTLNITKAAQNMYVSQTAVTKQLQLLEAELGFELFSRENKQMQLTEGGAFFKKEVLPLMHQYQLTRQNLSAYRKGEAGCINIGFLRYLDIKLIIPYLSTFRERYPKIDINLCGYSNQELHQRIQNGSLDIGFGYIMNDSNFHYYLLNSYSLAVYTSKDSSLAARSEVSEWELKDLIFDIRNCPLECSMDYEGLLIKIACGYGNAVVYNLTGEDIHYQDYVVSVPLYPPQKKDISLIYDDHYSRIKDLFIDTYVKKQT